MEYHLVVEFSSHMCSFRIKDTLPIHIRDTWDFGIDPASQQAGGALCVSKLVPNEWKQNQRLRFHCARWGRLKECHFMAADAIVYLCTNSRGVWWARPLEQMVWCLLHLVCQPRMDRVRCKKIWMAGNHGGSYAFHGFLQAHQVGSFAVIAYFRNLIKLFECRGPPGYSIADFSTHLFFVAVNQHRRHPTHWIQSPFGVADSNGSQLRSTSI